uniref:Uncharacterized protein n=1 Tax=Utricularia reniformis TaxID=192314 RepID=A0A1Y0AYV5_9LAMI|nr:hypothetical protein AEK19_MT0918 [Utricularia reniformis]ART30331.1 hypothetical protein AEK19_MT0918 [Utricularia reniformis]
MICTEHFTHFFLREKRDVNCPRSRTRSMVGRNGTPWLLYPIGSQERIKALKKMPNNLQAVKHSIFLASKKEKAFVCIE